MFFWSFPSKAIQSKRTKLADTQQSLATTQDSHRKLHKQLEQARTTRQQTKERQLKLTQLTTLRSKKRALDDELKQYEVCDPDRLKKLKAGVAVCRDSANRWTENCQLVVQYFKKKGIDMEAGVSVRRDMAYSTTSAAVLTSLPCGVLTRTAFSSSAVGVSLCVCCVVGCVPARWIAQGHGCIGVRAEWMCCCG